MKILSVDVEANGLLGKPFAVGAVFAEYAPGLAPFKILSEFYGRCPIAGPVDPWVEKNVFPSLQKPDRKENFPSLTSMASKFSAWAHSHAEHESCEVFADCGYPVEANFFRECTQFGMQPYPLHEIATLFLAAGLDPDCDRIKFLRDRRLDLEVIPRPHDPISDAMISGICAIYLLKLLQTR